MALRLRRLPASRRGSLTVESALRSKKTGALVLSLTPGVRLGPYEIKAPLGARGMGDVYRARDTRLEREVALKILPDEVSADAERRARALGGAPPQTAATARRSGEQSSSEMGGVNLY